MDIVESRTKFLQELISSFYELSRIEGNEYKFNYQKLNFVDKIMMTIFKFILKKQKEEEMDDNTKGMLDAYDNPVDFVNKESIKPIIESLNTMKL